MTNTDQQVADDFRSAMAASLNRYTLTSPGEAEVTHAITGALVARLSEELVKTVHMYSYVHLKEDGITVEFEQPMLELLTALYGNDVAESLVTDYCMKLPGWEPSHPQCPLLDGPVHRPPENVPIPRPTQGQKPADPEPTVRYTDLPRPKSKRLWVS